MLEQLFSSKTRVKLLSLFLSHPNKSYYVRELTRRLDERINSIRRELANLETVGILQSKTIDRKRYYTVETDFYCFDELQNLFMKVRVGPEDRISQKLQKIDGITYCLLTGFFSNEERSSTDVLIVGTVNKKKVHDIISQFEQEFDREINYTIMDTDEFEYRREMDDLFVGSLLKKSHVIVIDKLAKTSADTLMSIKKLDTVEGKK